MKSSNAVTNTELIHFMVGIFIGTPPISVYKKRNVPVIYGKNGRNTPAILSL